MAVGQLNNVLPDSPLSDGINQRFADVVLLRKDHSPYSCRQINANLPNFVIIQFSKAVADAYSTVAMGASAFLETVAEVVTSRAKKEVCRVDAGGVVAARTVVADFQAGWDWSVSQHPCQTMSVDSAVPPSVARLSYCASRVEPPVTEGVVSCLVVLEYPALALDDFGPESLGFVDGEWKRDRINLGHGRLLESRLCSEPTGVRAPAGSFVLAA